MCYPRWITAMEQALADGKYTGPQEDLQRRRFERAVRVFESEGEDTAWHSDMLFVTGGTD